MLTTAAVLAATSAVPPPAVAREPAATQPVRTDPAERLGPFLKVVRESRDARTVMSTYTRALAFARDNVELHRVYLRQMLRFGLPQIALTPARELVRLGSADARAWGVIGYMHGRGGEPADALIATLKAAELGADDPSVLNNAGQLVAWHDFEPDPPRLPDATRRTLAKLRPALAEKAAYQQAYRRLQAAYARQAVASRELGRKVNNAEAEALAVQRLARDVDSRLRELNEEIDYHERLIEDLYRELRYGYGYYYYYRDPDGRYIYVPRYDRYYRRQEIRDRIREAEREIEKVRIELRRVRRDGRAVLAELARKEGALKDLRVRLREATGRTEREFRWDPPAVGGVVTAEKDRIPPTVGKPKLKVPVDPETEARQNVELAKLYLRHGMSEKAIALLESVAKAYAETQAGRQARVLLSALRPQE